MTCIFEMHKRWMKCPKYHAAYRSLSEEFPVTDTRKTGKQGRGRGNRKPEGRK